ncbi:MAG: hypothetical protein AB7I32_16090 [Gammaproteobacteria bacterium]
MKHRKGLMLSGMALLGALLVSGAQAAGTDEERHDGTFNGNAGTGNTDSMQSGERDRPATGSSSTGGAMEDGTSGSTTSGGSVGGDAGSGGTGGASGSAY